MLEITPTNRRDLRRRNMDDFWDLARWTEGFFDDPFNEISRKMAATFKLDVQDLEHSYRVEAELPGVMKEEIKLDYHDGVLSICVNRTQDVEEDESQYIRRERRMASMSRSIRLPDVIAGDIDARLEDGILKIQLPKTENAEKRVEIEVK